MSTPTSQQFEGTTIEEALAAAVELFGDDLEIIDAQRVRRRKMLGVRRQDRFEVTVAPRSKAEPRGFEDVLARMVDRVDEAERSLGSDLADTDRTWWAEAEFVVPPQPEDHSAGGRSRRASRAAVEVDVRQEPAVAAAQQRLTVDDLSTTASDGAERPAARHSAYVVPAGTSPTAASASGTDDDASRPGRTAVLDRVATPQWSAEALLELGLPAALVGRVRVDEGAGDLEWVSGLASAIAELLDTAESLSGPCELTGHGAESAIHLIRGACDGFRVGSIVIDGKQAPATPLELSLAVRSLLRVTNEGEV